MKLLIVTQRVDKKDPILGFFHRWIEEFAKNCDQVTIIGQMVGQYDLPKNVCVESLWKEKGALRITQIIRFWVFQWRLRKQYDRVIVHMTPIWIVLGAPLWILLRKKMYLWYEVKRGRWYLPIALRLVRQVFCATKQGLPRPSKKQCILGHGIDTEFFKPDPSKKDPKLIATVGRITPVKNLDLVIEAFSHLPSDCRLEIAGGAFISSDKKEQERLESLIAGKRPACRQAGLEDRVSMGFKTHSEVRDLLQRTNLFLHASAGGLDKVVLEAAAAGCKIVSCCEAAAQILPDECMATPETFSVRAKEMLNEDGGITKILRGIVIKDHSLSDLIKNLCSKMGN